MPGGPEVYAWSAFVVVRLDRGSVVLDQRSNCIFELGEAASLALDVLADRESWVTRGRSDDLCVSARESLPAIRRELLGERDLAPGQGLTVEGRTGEPLLRRLAEPPHWRTVPARVSSQRSPTVELAGGLVTLGSESLVVLAGRRRDARELAHGFAEMCWTGTTRDILELDEEGPSVPRLRSRASGHFASVSAVWSLDSRATANVVLSRLGQAASLVALLDAVQLRPNLPELVSLARASVALPHFRANVPRGGPVLAETLRRYGTR
jgi:hypothetical protein